MFHFYTHDSEAMEHLYMCVCDLKAKGGHLDRQFEHKLSQLFRLFIAENNYMYLI